MATKAIIVDYLTGEEIDVTHKPEEIVRQEYIKKLVEEYGYPKTHIAKEVHIQGFSDDEYGRADIVVYTSDKKLYDEIYIIVECKARDKKEGEKQAKSYGSHTTAEIVVWHNGEDPTEYWQRLKTPHKYISKGYLPKYGKFYGDKKILKSDLRPASNLRQTFSRIHDNVYANAPSGNKSKVFGEMLNLIFAKMQDEKSYEEECQFVVYDKEWDDIQEKGESETFVKRITELFNAVKESPEFKQIFGNDEKITLPIPQIAYIVSELENISILETDVKGEAYQAFLSGHFRGDAGQFFTPDPIKEMIVSIMDPKPNEIVLDPACGSGGFLVFTIYYWNRFIKKLKKWTNEDGTVIPDNALTVEQREIIKLEVKTIANKYIRGADFDADLTKVAKMYMVMVDDGHTGIFTVDSLLDLETVAKITGNEIGKECANVIMTNPPFGTKGKVGDKQKLINFDLGYKWTFDKKSGEYKKTDKLMSGKTKGSGQVPDILFIERCVQLLKPNGRAALVLPDGDLANQKTEYVRQWLRDNVQLVAVISLPDETFVPFGANVKSSVVIFKKPFEKNVDGKLIKEIPEEYPVFFGTLERIGYDVRGRKIYKRNEKGQVISKTGEVLDNQDKASIEKMGMVDSDIPTLLEEWNNFRQKYKELVW